MAANGESVKEAILALIPADGSTIGNQSLLSAIQGKLPELTEDDYLAARDLLISKGVLGRGRGRGGSVFLQLANDVADNDEDGDEEEEGDNFELTEPPRDCRRLVVLSYAAMGSLSMAAIAA